MAKIVHVIGRIGNDYVKLSTVCDGLWLSSTAFQAVLTNPLFFSQGDFCSMSQIQQCLQTLCSFLTRYLPYCVCNSVLTNPMFVPNAISAAIRTDISDYKAYLRSWYYFQHDFNINRWLQTLCSCPKRFLQYFSINHWFLMRFLQIYVINQWLQILCLFPMRFLGYFGCKSIVTNPMFVPNVISAVSRM